MVMQHPTHKSTSGFTLIELLIVIAIIGTVPGSLSGFRFVAPT
ncbi:MAG TPA: type II secretion system protein, partial [Nitrospinaceae bacterium]|nr:type II secretion system protein [Nitrospinaceae bacterium]